MTKKKIPILPIAFIVGLLLWARPAKGSSSEDELFTLSYLGRDDLPLSFRNNNPGNLKISNSPWQGKIPVSQNTDGTFEQFTSFVWGVRAMLKLLSNYYNLEGRNTIQLIITKYAPNTENNSSAYINTVAQKTGFGPTQVFSLTKENLFKLSAAMAEVEAGKTNVITRDMYNIAYDLI